MNMKKSKFVTPLDYPRIIHSKIFRDNRGWFYEAYNISSFALEADFIQDNHSFSEHKGTIRGLHLQKPPFEQAKLIRVLKGKIFDVVVDLRPNSKYYLQVSTFELDDDKKSLLFIPKGFAHGFMTMEDNTEVYYKVDELYNKNYELTIAFNDPTLNIPWPKSKEVILSNKDSEGIYLEKAIEVLKESYK